MKPLFGPYMQEYLLYRTGTQNKMLKDLNRLGCTAFAFNPWAVKPPSIDARSPRSIFTDFDLAKVSPWVWRRLDKTNHKLTNAKIQPIIYGPMFPDIRGAARRDFLEYFAGLRFFGKEITLREWEEFTGRAKEAWSYVWLQLTERYKDDFMFVDATEPFTHHLPPPPNSFTDHIRSITHDHVVLYQAGISEFHINPGDDYHTQNFPAGRHIIATDGWGVNRTAWKTPRPRLRKLAGLPPRLMYAGLPHGNTEKEVGRWFRRLYKNCTNDERFAMLVLHTTGWPFYSNPPSPTRTGISGIDIEPFSTIYKMLAKESKDGT